MTAAEIESFAAEVDGAVERAKRFILHECYHLRKDRVPRAMWRKVISGRLGIQSRLSTYAFVAAWEVLDKREHLI